jgi:hypothetical protein
MKDFNEKTYNTVLSECNDFFRAQGVSIIGEGFKEVASNPALFESYVDQLTEGSSADAAATMAQLMANTNANILRESSMTGIQPIASLSMPVIRKLWPKFALKDALETEVAKTPRFTVNYTAPYMYKGDDAVENRVYLPRGIDKRTYTDLAGNAALHKDYTVSHTVSLAAGAASVVDFTYENGVSGTTDAAVVIADTPSAVKKQPLDELVIVSATVDAVVGTGSSEAPQYPAVAIKIGKRLGVYGNAVYPFDGGQLLVQFDGQSRKATFAAIGKAVTLVVKAGVSTEYNESSWSVGFDIKRQDIDIPTGQHLNAPLPIEALNDMMALYQIDGTKETVDLMTNVFAQKLDLEVLQFLTTSWKNQPSNEAFADDTVHFPGATSYYWTFDCKPAAGFAGSPKAWREEIKPLIDHAAQKIKNNTYLQAGMFTIVANPLDVQILANVDWQFRGGQGGNMDGVDVDYSVGTYVGANAYKVIASTNVPAGRMFLLFTPSSGTQMTYKYYPYTFSTEMGYVDPNRSRTPSIMMTKRHTFHEFMPAIAVIAILHNDGKGYFAQYTNTRTVTGDGSYDADVTDDNDTGYTYTYGG